MIDFTTVNLHDAISNTHVELALDDAFHVNAVGNEFVFRGYLTGEFDFPRTQ